MIVLGAYLRRFGSKSGWRKKKAKFNNTTKFKKREQDDSEYIQACGFV